MAKLRKSRNSVFKTITTTTGKALPVVNNGLNTVGSVAKGVAVKSIPVIQSGVSTVYGTMSNGLDLGVRGVKTVARGINLNKKRRTRRHKHSNKCRHRRTHKKRH
jgi:phage-related protein